MKKYSLFGLNALAVIGYLLGLALYHFNHIVYLEAFFGLTIFILIGLNLAFFVNTLGKNNLSFLQQVMLAVASAPLLLGLAVWQSQALKFSLDPKKIMISIIVLYLSSLILALGGLLQAKRDNKRTKRHSLKLFWIALGLAGAFLIVNFSLYRYIPESDGYYYLDRLAEFKTNPLTANDSLRVIFYGFIVGLNYLTKIPNYWILKIVIPLMSLIAIIPGYEIAQNISKRSSTIVLCALFPFLIPVVSMEALYARPQILFAFAFITFIYLGASVIANREKYSSIALFLYLIFLSIIGLKVHPFFFFALITLAIFSINLIWRITNHKPGRFALIILALLVIFYPYLQSYGLLSQLVTYSRVLISAIIHPKFDLWFIGSYKNIDGSQMGWPGFYALVYYAYNLGLAFIASVILYASVSKKAVHRQMIWPYLVPLAIFIAIAEILPRIGLTTYPDRAWLYVSLSLGLLAPFIVINSAEFLSRKAASWFCITIIVISFFTAWSITYFKQGWISPNEVKVAKQISQIAPQNSIVLSQPSNFALFSTFVKADFVDAGSNFFKSDENNKKAEVKIQGNIDQQIDEIVVANELLIAQKNEIAGRIANSTDDRIIREAQAEIADKNTQMQANFKEIAMLRTYGSKRAVFVLYSSEKFDSLYGRRQWWRTMNSYTDSPPKLDFCKQIQTGFDKIWLWDCSKIND